MLQLMWSVKEVTDVGKWKYVQKGCESHTPTGLRRIRVGGLASHVEQVVGGRCVFVVWWVCGRVLEWR